MIVKNESAVICRGLNNIQKWIDYWVIVDTGSTDGTQEIIRNALQDIPGELWELPWVSFAHNRNEALDRARNKADYIFFTDADDQIMISDSFSQVKLDKDFYIVSLTGNGVNYYRILMVNNDPGWFWDGVLHEYITNLKPVLGEILPGIVSCVSTQDGGRSSDPDKYLNDARVLEEALQKEPMNSRHVFYLAQIYRAAGEAELALKYYEKRASMQGLPEEVFWSLYNMAKIQQEMEMDPQIFISSYLSAFQSDQTRAEPLYRLAYYFNLTGQYFMAYLIAKVARPMVPPIFYVAIEEPVYDYGVMFELAYSAYRLGKADEARVLNEILLKKTTLPPAYRDQILNYSAIL